MISVRPAGLDDLPWLLEQLLAFDKFVGSSRSLFPTLDVAEDIVSGLVLNHPFFIAQNASGPIGFIAGMLTPHYLNPSITVLAELFWWVPEEHRGSRAGALLLAELLAVGRRCADQIIMTLETESPVAPRSLINRGFREKETSYLLEVNP